MKCKIPANRIDRLRPLSYLLGRPLRLVFGGEDISQRLITMSLLGLGVCSISGALSASFSRCDEEDVR